MAKRSVSPEPIELDLNRYELRRAGKRIGIERIPMELLILLAKSGGRLVSREEIVEHLWGKNPFLDAERNLNTAVGKLRHALGESADRPRLIETVVGKGYRFVIPDSRDDAGELPGHNGDARFEVVGASVKDEPDPASGPGQEVSSVRAAGGRRSGWLVGVLLVAAALALSFVAVWYWPQPPRQMIPHYEQITSGDAVKYFNLGEYPLPVLTDSLRLYFPIYSTTGNPAIGQIAAAGGESGVFNTTLKSPLALDVSPDGSSLLVASPAVLPEAPLWVQPIPNGQPRRLGQVEARDASWAPNGLRISYSTVRGLFTIRSDGTAVTQLVPINPDTGQQIYWPRWSHDGKRLRYTLYDPGTGHHWLWEVGADGTGAHSLLPGWNAASNICCGSWTPDDRFFVFAATRNGRSDIWAIPDKTRIIDRSSQQPFQLTAGPISFSSPLPARDGDIYVAGAETKGELARWAPGPGSLTPWLGGASVVGVSSSRDGAWIAYTSFPDRTLWRSRADGSEKLELTTQPMEAYLPRWSPDGSQIAFYARTPGMPFQIYVVPAYGGTPQRPIPGKQQQIDPTWSRDGRELMFESDPPQERGSGRKTQIEIFDLQTGKSSLLPGSEGKVSPRWSPDGRSVAAMPADSSGLLLYDFQTRGWTQLLQAQIGYPNWSHDGKYIYFDWFSSPGGVRRIRISDHQVIPVFSRQPQDALLTSDDWTGLTADDSVLLLRNVSIQEIYAIRWHGPLAR